MTQGPGGRYSHTGVKGRYAFDIAMPEGTPIVAARAGQVVKIENNQSGRGTNPSGNFVRLLHAINATWPHPAHTLYNGAIDASPAQNFLSCLLPLLPASPPHLMLLEFGYYFLKFHLNFLNVYQNFF